MSDTIVVTTPVPSTVLVTTDTPTTVEVAGPQGPQGAAGAATEVSTVNVTGNTTLTAGRTRLIYLNAAGGLTANVTLPYADNVNGDSIVLISLFNGSSNTGALTIRSAGQMSGGSPIGYDTLTVLTSTGNSVTVVSDGSNGFGGWRITASGGSFPSTTTAVQEYDVNGVLLPNGDSGAGVQLTRNTATPQAPDGSDRTFNAEQLIYTRTGSTAVRMDTFLKDKSQWFWTSAPATKTSTGTTSQVAYDSNYFYMCVATNKWVRIALATNW